MADSGGVAADGRVDAERVGKAVDALLKWVASSKEQERVRLLDEEQFLYLVVALNKIPHQNEARINPYRIQLSHPLTEVDGSQEICLIVNDLSRGMLRKEAKQRVLQEGLRISKVLGITKLRKNFSTYEAKRKLCGSYDLFLADRSIVGRLPNLLGKVFYKKKKHPIPINLSMGQWKSQFENVCKSTCLYLGTGSCSVVKVAKVSQARDDIIENVLAAIEGVASSVPKKWKNIMALHLKALESLALPIYQSAPAIPLRIDANLGAQQNVTRMELKPESSNAKSKSENDSSKQEHGSSAKIKASKQEDGSNAKPKASKQEDGSNAKPKASKQEDGSNAKSKASKKRRDSIVKPKLSKQKKDSDLASPMKKRKKVSGLNKK